LGADVGGDATAIEHAMETMLAHTYRSWGNLVDVPAFIPTPSNVRFRHALQAVDQIVYRLIAAHRAEGSRTNSNLLSVLLQVRDEQSGDGLSDSELRNETITFLLAGHETTANPPTWDFYPLSHKPSL